MMLANALALGVVRRGGGGRLSPFLDHWATVRQSVEDGTLDWPKIACIGNSKTAGVGTHASAGNTGYRVNSYPFYMGQRLAELGLPTSVETLSGSHAMGNGSIAAYAAYDPRVSFGGAGWAFTVNTLGGACFGNVAATEPLTYTVGGTEEFDTFDIYYVRNTGWGSCDVQVNGGAVTTLDGNGTLGMAKTTIAATASANPVLTFTPQGNGSVQPWAVHAKHSERGEVAVFNVGRGSWTSTDTADYDTMARAGRVLETFAPDLTIICLDTNDYTPAYGPIDLATFEANIQNLITSGKLSGDVIVVSEYPSAITRQTLEIQQQYWEVERALAASNDCLYLNLPNRVGGSYETAPDGYYFDETHLKAVGYEAQGNWFADELMRPV